MKSEKYPKTKYYYLPGRIAELFIHLEENEWYEKDENGEEELFGLYYNYEGIPTKSKVCNAILQPPRHIYNMKKQLIARLRFIK